MSSTEVPERTGQLASRLSELDEEILGLRGKLRRNHEDETLVRRIRHDSPELENELSELRDERGRLESAFLNLKKERGELTEAT